MSVEVSLRHSFGAFALDVAFQIERPGVTALFGPSGAGKTSVVNAIAGLFRPDEGRIVDRRSRRAGHESAAYSCRRSSAAPVTCFRTRACSRT